MKQRRQSKQRCVVVITGTPGTGKSTLAKRYVRKGYTLLDIKKLIRQGKIPKGYDKKRKCWTVDPKTMNKVLLGMIKHIKGNAVIEGHISHLLPARYVDLCIVTRCSLKTLHNRLRKRGYAKSKINENMESEIMEIILDEAQKMGHKIRVVRTG